MNWRSPTFFLGVVLLLSAVYWLHQDKPPVFDRPTFDHDGCIDGKIPVVLELTPGTQLKWCGYQTSLAELKKGIEQMKRNQNQGRPQSWHRPLLIVANERISESRVTDLINLFADTSFAPIFRVRSYPDKSAMKTAENPKQASSAAQTEKFALIESQAGLKLPASAKMIEFYESEDTWWTKIEIPEASFLEFKEAIYKKGNCEFPEDLAGWKPTWWNNPDPAFRRLTIGSHFVFSLETIAAKEDGEYAVYMVCAAH